MKKIILLLLQAILILALAACSVVSAAGSDTSSASQESAVTEAVPVTSNTGTSSTPLSVSYDSEDLNANPNLENGSSIELNGDSIAFEGVGATVNGSVITITSAGTYRISGLLNDGQIAVNTADSEPVTLIFNGVNISNSTSAPIYVLSANKTIITLANGTENTVTDAASYVFANAEDDEPNAAIFSKDDLTINGSGSLTVNANYSNGIVTHDDLKITSGNITVNAVNDAIKGRNYIAVKDGTITLNAGGDGLQSNNDEDATKGYILIEGGTLNITSAMDGIQAETRLTISAGNINIVSGGGSVVNYELEESTKGLKAGLDITIAGGTLNIDSADDSLHSNNSITIDGGEITVASGDDGAHSDSTLTMNSGSLVITKAYEGIESETITLNDGSIHLSTEDDGVNGSGGVDSSSTGMGPGQDMFETGNAHLYINGGYLFVDAVGDGIDINGPIDMSGGTVIVNGPENNGNGPLDYSGSFNLTGGYLLAVGSSGMAQAPSTSSTQYSILYNFDSIQAPGTLLHIASEDGAEVLTFMPTRSYQSMVLSSPELETGSTYLVYTGGSSTGTNTDGLYSEGTYTPGSQAASFTISSMVSTAGGFGPGGGQGGPPRP